MSQKASKYKKALVQLKKRTQQRCEDTLKITKDMQLLREKLHRAQSQLKQMGSLRQKKLDQDARPKYYDRNESRDGKKSTKPSIKKDKRNEIHQNQENLSILKSNQSESKNSLKICNERIDTIEEEDRKFRESIEQKIGLILQKLEQQSRLIKERAIDDPYRMAKVQMEMNQQEYNARIKDADIYAQAQADTIEQLEQENEKLKFDCQQQYQDLDRQLLRQMHGESYQEVQIRL